MKYIVFSAWDGVKGKDSPMVRWVGEADDEATAIMVARADVRGHDDRPVSRMRVVSMDTARSKLRHKAAEWLWHRNKGPKPVKRPTIRVEAQVHIECVMAVRASKTLMGDVFEAGAKALGLWEPKE